MSFISYAQNWEDVMLWRALKDVSNGFYIDVGAHDPRHGTVTRAFYERGWSGINIEPTARFHNLLCNARPRDVNLRIAIGERTQTGEFFEIPETGLSTLDPNVAAAHRESGWTVTSQQVSIKSLNEVWAEHVGSNVHFLKIDVEGTEPQVLAGIDLRRNRPWIIVVEATLPLTQTASYDAWEHRLLDNDYLFVYFDGLNRFYVAAEKIDLQARFSAPPNFFDDFKTESEFEALRELAELRAKLGAELSAQAAEGGEEFNSAASPFLGLSAAEPTLAAPKSQLCTEGQFREAPYAEWCAKLKEAPKLHSKQWGFVYILQALASYGLLAAGRRGLGFGCGKEPLPAVMAAHGCEVVATDLDPESARGRGWIETDEHASQLADLNDRGICDPAIFARNVSFRADDMNNISADLAGFDFVWSSCAFEHLGSIAHGLRFVTNAMRCLKPGGIAVHTTEFNLTSNLSTIESPHLSVFRKYDIDHLIFTLNKAGHTVAPLNLNPGSGWLDRYVDLPPYRDEPHLRLKVDRYVLTAIGLIVTRGR